MDSILIVYEGIKNNIGPITEVIAYLCLLASAIVKITPTVKDDNFFKPIISFIGKYLALDKYGPATRPE